MQKKRAVKTNENIIRNTFDNKHMLKTEFSASFFYVKRERLRERERGGGKGEIKVTTVKKIIYI